MRETVSVVKCDRCGQDCTNDFKGLTIEADDIRNYELCPSCEGYLARFFTGKAVPSTDQGIDQG